MLKCLIVEDEPLAQKVLERYIMQTPDLQLAGIYNNAVAAFGAFHTLSVDLLFLDIRMPVINGVDFLRSLKQPPRVVFTTAYAEYAVQSYELEAVDYLLKPITLERFQLCMEKVFRTAKTSPAPPPKNYLFIKVDGRLVKVLLEDILFIESMKDYLKIHTGKGEYITHMTMKTVSSLLPEASFIRIHRSYIVALEKLHVVGASTVEICQHKIPVGESYRKRLAAIKAGL